MDTRTVKPNGEKLKAQRIARGLRVEDVARKSRRSARTVENAEKGSRVHVATLAAIAAVLGVNTDEVIEGAELAASEASRRFRVQIVIEGDLEQLNRSDNLLNLVYLLQQMAQPTPEIKILGAMPGSVILVLEIEEAGALRLAEMFPDFEEHARELTRLRLLSYLEADPDLYEQTRSAIVKSNDGKGYFRITADIAGATMFMYAYSAFEMAKRVRELRLYIPANGGEPNRADEPELEKIGDFYNYENVEIQDVATLEDFLENILRPQQEPEQPTNDAHW